MGTRCIYPTGLPGAALIHLLKPTFLFDFIYINLLANLMDVRKFTLPVFVDFIAPKYIIYLAMYP
ncbi:MAG: hypothetical protein K6348_02610 [Deferribacterales bacterium]